MISTGNFVFVGFVFGIIIFLLLSANGLWGAKFIGDNLCVYLFRRFCVLKFSKKNIESISTISGRQAWRTLLYLNVIFLHSTPFRSKYLYIKRNSIVCRHVLLDVENSEEIIRDWDGR